MMDPRTDQLAQPGAFKRLLADAVAEAEEPSVVCPHGFQIRVECECPDCYGEEEVE